MMYRAIESEANGSKYSDGKGALRTRPDHSTILRRFSHEWEIIQTFAKDISALARERQPVAFHIDSHPLRYRFTFIMHSGMKNNKILFFDKGKKHIAQDFGKTSFV